jgi:hypothetical protein
MSSGRSASVVIISCVMRVMLPNGRTIVERIIHAEPIAAQSHHARATRTRPSLAGAVPAEHAAGG